MKKIISLVLGSLLLSPSFSAQAVSFRSLAELQKATIADKHNALLIANDTFGNCTIFGDPLIAKNSGIVCNSTSSSALKLGALNAQVSGSAKGATCASLGGSKSGAAGDVGTFCIAADINTTKTPPANFSVANGKPMTGLQFMQVSLRDGSKLVGSMPIPSPASTIANACFSVGKSKAGAAGAAGDFCIASDLLLTNKIPAQFAVANSLPVASLQIIQITFQGAGTGQSTTAGANCKAGSGSASANKDPSGFCLVADLKSPTTDLASFAIANQLPAAGLQFLQVTFKDGHSVDTTGRPLNAPNGAACSSKSGSTASTGATGEYCVVSMLSTIASGFANFSMANDLPVEGLQFLQAAFTGGAGAANNAKCLSSGGSSSGTGNLAGFCLAADRVNSSASFADLSVANNLPVSSLQFVQVPFRTSGQTTIDPRKPVNTAAAIGVTVSDLPNQTVLPDFARKAGQKQRYFRIKEEESGIVLRSGAIKKTVDNPLFWIGR